MSVHVIKGPLRRRAAPIGYRMAINGHDVRERSDYVTVVRRKIEEAVQQVIWMEAGNEGLKDTKRILFAACEAEHAC